MYRKVPVMGVTLLYMATVLTVAIALAAILRA
jgi:hypothetical protein